MQFQNLPKSNKLFNGVSGKYTLQLIVAGLNVKTPISWTFVRLIYFVVLLYFTVVGRSDSLCPCCRYWARTRQREGRLRFAAQNWTPVPSARQESTSFRLFCIHHRLPGSSAHPYCSGILPSSRVVLNNAFSGWPWASTSRTCPPVLSFFFSTVDLLVNNNIRSNNIIIYFQPFSVSTECAGCSWICSKPSNISVS